MPRHALPPLSLDTIASQKHRDGDIPNMPGSGKQPQHVQEHIKELLQAGLDPNTIHKRLKVGRSTVYRMKKSLQQYGTNYAPPDTNKKNGRPKVLTPEQELAIRDWLRVPGNRDRYLDDLVWHIHQQFNVVCSTTTVSKMKRKWLRVIDDSERNPDRLPDAIPAGSHAQSKVSTASSQHDSSNNDPNLQQSHPHRHLQKSPSSVKAP